MIDHSDQVRRAVIKMLKLDDAMGALVADRIHDQVPASPVWPFSYFGNPEGLPAGNSCGEGSRIEFGIHSFSKGPGRAEISQINATVVNAFNDSDFDVTGTLWDVEVMGTRIIPDGAEANAHHGIVTVAMTII